MRPFYSLVIKAVRRDSHGLILNGRSLSEEVTDLRLRTGLTQQMMAAKLGTSLKTFQNWELAVGVLSARQGEIESRSFAHLGFGPDAPPVTLDDSLHN